MRGLKPGTDCRPDRRASSHPTWVRGLKQYNIADDNVRKKSHPTWVRGLKHVEYPHKLEEHKVAPYVGAWIETGIIKRGVNA